MSEPKKETVRITLPPRPVPDPRAVASAKASGRITLPPKPGVPSVPRPVAPVVPRPMGQPISPVPTASPAPSAPVPVAMPRPALPGSVAVPRAAAPGPVAVPRPAAPSVPRPAAPIPVAKVSNPLAGEHRLEVAPPGVTGAPLPRPVPVPVTKSGTARLDFSAEAPRPVVARISAPSVPTVKIAQTQPMREAPLAKLRPASLSVAAAEGDGDDSGGSGIPAWTSYLIFGCALVTFGVQLWMFLAGGD